MRHRPLVVAFVLLAACSSAEPPDADPPAVEETNASSALPPATSKGVDAGASDPRDQDASSGAPKAPCTVSFSKEVLPAIAKGGCTTVACHGTRFREPRLEAKDAEITYKALVAYKIGDKPYVSPTSTSLNDSSMSCHLHGACGTKMPPNGGEIPKELVAVVDTWLACGAPKN